jgi:hypothetical protein
MEKSRDFFYIKTGIRKIVINSNFKFLRGRYLMARRRVYPLGKHGPRELSGMEAMKILAERSRVTREVNEKKGRKRRRSNLDD